MTGAYSFVCSEGSTQKLCARLNDLGGWRWTIGDSYWYGDYARCIPFPGVKLRIVDFPVRTGDEFTYNADVRLTPDCGTPMVEIDRTFRDVLVQIGARDIREIQPFD